MAEFCLECFNRINETTLTEKECILSKSAELCEGCGKYKPVFITEKKWRRIQVVRLLALPVRFVFAVLYFLWRVLLLPYILILYRKKKRSGK